MTGNQSGAPRRARRAAGRARSLAVLAVILVTAACGQKAGVGDPEQAVGPGSESGAPAAAAATAGSGEQGVPFESAAPPEAAAATPTTSVLPGGSSPAGGAARAGAAATGPEQPSAPAGAAGRPTTTTSGPAARAERAAAAQPPPAAAGQSADPRDREGVTDKEIVIGMHAPITGAAPVPQDSVDKAKDLYFKFLAERGGIFGRNVRVVFRDDQFNPSRAVAVCRELVEQEHAFMLVGIGTDQIVSCARYASQVGVPYFAMGGSESAVTGLKTYFGLSQSYPQQAPMVAQMVKKEGKTKVGVVVTNTPNYDDTFNSLVAGAKGAGLSVVRADRISKQASQSEVLAVVNNLRTAGAQAVLLFVAPVTFLNLAHAAQSQAYTPLWTGPGMSNGLNLVAEFGCPSIAGARFLSPFPQVDVIDRFDTDYKPTYRKYNKGEEPDDLGLAVWGMEKTLHQFLKAVGPNLGRAALIRTLQSGQEFSSNIFPPLRYAPGKPYGSTQSHLLEADCSKRQYRTLATFASSF
jgi:ABC-type branched-subunit amino acid transport system substrate-binding protein